MLKVANLAAFWKQAPFEWLLWKLIRKQKVSVLSFTSLHLDILCCWCKNWTSLNCYSSSCFNLLSSSRGKSFLFNCIKTIFCMFIPFGDNLVVITMVVKKKKKKKKEKMNYWEQGKDRSFTREIQLSVLLQVLIEFYQ